MKLLLGSFPVHVLTAGRVTIWGGGRSVVILALLIDGGPDDVGEGALLDCAIREDSGLVEDGGPFRQIDQAPGDRLLFGHRDRKRDSTAPTDIRIAFHTFTARYERALLHPIAKSIRRSSRGRCHGRRHALRSPHYESTKRR